MNRERRKNEISRFLPFPRELGEAAIKKIEFLDCLVAMREDAEEMEHCVKVTAREVAAVFCGYLLSRGLQSGIEVLAAMAEHFIDDVYLNFETRRPTLAKLSKKDISQFVHICEFAVPENDWVSGINPFNGLGLFFEFLQEFGYPAKLETKCRALQELKRTIIKHPVPETLAKAVTELQ